MALFPFGSQQSNQQSTSPLGSIGVKATYPGSTTPQPKLTLPPSQVNNQPTAPSNPSTQNGTGGIDYTLHPGETISAYNSRIASAQGGAANLSTPQGPAIASNPDASGKQTITPVGQVQAPPPVQPPVQPQGSQAQAGQPTQPPQPFAPSAGLYGQLIQALGNKASQPSADYQAAQAQAQGILGQMSQLQQNQAQQTANLEGSPIDLSLATGQEGILNRLFAAKQAALAGQYAGATNLLGAANTQQQLEQAGLGAAGQLAQPQQFSPTGIPFNPATGQFGAIAGNAAQGGGGQGLFNIGQLLQGQTLGAQSATLSATQNQARSIADQLNQLFQGAGKNINPADIGNNLSISPANGLFQLGANVLGDPNYQTFSNLLNDLISRYSQILTPAGGNPTDARLQIAQSLINKLASKESIQQVLADLDQQASGVIKNLNPNNPPPPAPQGSVLGGGQTGYTFGNGSFFGQ